jgi:multisubunit Na+/H+ antiporter MnhB subunit
MLDLIRQTLKLLRDKPVLWLPMACASIVAYSTIQARSVIGRVTFGMAMRELARNPTAGLGSAEHAMSVPAAALIFVPSSIALFLIAFLAYSAALFAIARLAESCSGGQSLGLQPAMWGLARSARRLFGFACKMGAFWIALALPFGLALFGIIYRAHIGGLSLTVIEWITSILFNLVFAWLVTPSCLGLILGRGHRALNRETKTRARLVAMPAYALTVVIVHLVSMAINAYHFSFLSGHWLLQYFFPVAVAIVGDLPLTCTAVAFALIGAEPSESLAIPSPS